jgi:hypothetical protein
MKKPLLLFLFTGFRPSTLRLSTLFLFPNNQSQITYNSLFRVHSRFILFSSFFCLKFLCLLPQEGRFRGKSIFKESALRGRIALP